MHLCLRLFSVLVVLISFTPPSAAAYSLLTHEQLIDLTWQDSIIPLLMSRYPNLTAAQLQEARAYAYGGCVVQDIGYYPYGDRFFSNLTHYVRSGDFIVSLFRNSKNADELAFAIGALSHYISDSIGHPEATNIAVPLAFPALKKRYGPAVSYAQGKHQHVQIEFGFDIDQMAHQRVAPLRFQRQVGLKVPVRLLSESFYQTYGITHFSGNNGRFNVREYRFAVHAFIPRVSGALSLLHKGHEPADPRTPDALEIEKEFRQTTTADRWETYSRRAGIQEYLLAGLIFVLPKIGSLALVNIKDPTPKTEADYMHSLKQSLDALRTALHRFTPPQKPTDPDPPPDKGGTLPEDNTVTMRNRAQNSAERDPQTGEDASKPAPAARLPVDKPAERLKPDGDPGHPLPNRDLDTGHVVQPGGYSLTDSTYADLLHRLILIPQQPIPPGIVEDIQMYYKNLDAPFTTKKNAKRWNQVLQDLKTLKTMPTSLAPEPYPTYEADEDADSN
jgi:hypothetical protein